LTDKWQVELFLGKFFQSWLPDCDVVPREENNKALLELDLTPKIRQEEIFSLTYQDFVKGPVEDRDMPGDIWEFGRQVEGTEIYIKLKLFTTKSGKRFAKCISFHKAKWPSTYPFK
jgi:hypothetical protein